jgi:hypothetical protein
VKSLIVKKIGPGVFVIAPADDFSLGVESVRRLEYVPPLHANVSPLFYLKCASDGGEHGRKSTLLHHLQRHPCEGGRGNCQAAWATCPKGAATDGAEFN